jgi:hypothetical protein
MDHAFWLGVCRWYALEGLEWEIHHRPEELYLPWDGYNGGKVNHHWGCFLNPERYSTFREAMELVSSIHPNWAACKRGARAMHTRNVYQVLGRDLSHPSKFLICYAPTQGKGVKGGTNTAYMLAKLKGVPCFNLYVDKDRDRIVEWLQLDDEEEDNEEK